MTAHLKVIATLLILLLAGCSIAPSTADREAFVDRNRPVLTDAQAEAIVSGQVLMGMDTRQVRASWGAPSRTREQVTGSSRILTWYWGGPGTGTYQYVSFRNGRVISAGSL